MSTRSSSVRLTAVVVSVLALTSATRADPGRYIGTGSSPWQDFAGQTFQIKTQNVLGAFLFFWYDVTSGQHLTNQFGDDLTTHPNYDYRNPIPFSFRSKDWWKREIARQVGSGIDLVLPNYWAKGEGDEHWSNAGLLQLDSALADLEAQKSRAVKVGLFLDTTTFEGMDFAQQAAKDALYASIRDFYSRVRPNRWGRIDRKAIVVLYRKGGMKNLGGAPFKEASARFAREFGGVSLFFIGNDGFRNAGVPIGLTFEWGAETPAHNGVRVDNDIAVISPGSRHYNAQHKGDFGQDKLSRKSGETYRNAWDAALRSRKNIIFIETWNELHESSGVAPTREFGERELLTTKKYSEIFHSR